MALLQRYMALSHMREGVPKTARKLSKFPQGKTRAFLAEEQSVLVEI